MVHAVHTGVYDRVHNMQISKIQNEGMKNFCKKRISKVDFRVISPVVRWAKKSVKSEFRKNH